MQVLGITNRVSFSDFQLGQKDYKSGLGFHIRAKGFQIGAEITSRGKTNFKSGQGLQISAEHRGTQSGKNTKMKVLNK